ncbi:unnamed protein product [Brachionus calyciflorus]|uniref:Uncharacterized protein n=1 Tax=Brachionus calyciflorus TaxID=104777 RepID=A0A813Z3G8_9BILA|nr:unnamed protein product [Brachionus calyciflorus]
MKNKLSQHDISEYYELFRNTIDTYAENMLANNLISNDEKAHINNDRSFIISKVNELEKINLDCLKFEPFCFFIDKEFNKKKKNQDVPMFDHKNGFGKLIILKNQIDEDLVENIKNYIILRREPEDYDFDSYKDYLKFHIQLKLIEAQCSNLIIDLSNPESNILKIIKLFDYTERFKKIRFKNLKCLEYLINLKAVESLNTEISGMYPFPDYLGLFPFLKHLEISDSNWETLPSNGFASLKLLETLMLKKTKIRSIEKDAFKGLKNLIKLSFDTGRATILQNSMFNDLDNLKELSFDFFGITSIKPNTFKDLKNLETLSLNKNTIEQMDLNGLNCLKYLYLIDSEYKSKIDLMFFENCFNLTVINLEDFYSYDLQSNTFESLKCLKYLNISHEKLFLKDNIILTTFDFLKPLKFLEYLSVTLNEDLYHNFNLIELPSLKYLCIKCYTVPILENNFKNLVSLKIEFIKKLEPCCFNKLNGIRNLILFFNDNTKLGYIDSTYFNTLDNLDYLGTGSCNFSGYYLDSQIGECFAQLFDGKKKLNKRFTALINITNKDAEIDIYFGLSDETKNGIKYSESGNPSGWIMSL